MHTDDRDYYQQRAHRERLMAEISPDKAAANAHLQIAEEYERRAAADEPELRLAQA